MSGTMPTSPVPNKIDITSISPCLVSTTHSLKRQVRKRGGGVQLWSIALEYPAMKRADASPLVAFATKQNGQYETFIYSPPLMTALGNYSGTVTVNGAHTSGDSTVAVLGSSGTLSAGSWVKFADHTKIYQVVADSTTTITIFPALQEDVASTTVVTYNSPAFTVAMVADNFSFSISDAPALYRFKLTLIEVY